MEIQFDDEYRLITIPLNFVLQQKVTVKRKVSGLMEEEWVDLGYHGTLIPVLKQYIDIQRLSIKAKSIEELIMGIAEIDKRVDELEILKICTIEYLDDKKGGSKNGK